MERIPKTKFVCIEYPGVVQNEEKMLDTLGGEERVSKLYSDNTKRLELRWRPKDQYCRPAYADRHSTTNLLMHVRRRWRRKKTGPSHDTNPEIEEEIEAKMLGTVETTYRFKGQADMQYLPMCKKEDGTYESITESTYLDKPQPKSYLNKEVPLFLPPHLFSRIDQSMDYMYRKDQGDNVDTEITKDVIGLGRKRRAVCTFFRKFSDESDIPAAPMSGSEEHLKWVNKEDLEKVKKLFEERPIWSKGLIVHKTGIGSQELKWILPVIAYYFVTGPWRSLWVRFGYDPLQNKEAKLYQMIDFRMPSDLKTKAKRATLNYAMKTSVSIGRKRTSTIQQDHLEGGKSVAVDETPKVDYNYTFTPDFIPPHRQMFFQASDILIPEVNKLLHENDGKESECTERDGWGVLNFADECRKHMLTYVYEAWKKQGLQLGDASTAADDSTMDVNDDDQTFANEEDDDANVEDMETDWNEMLDYT